MSTLFLGVDPGLTGAVCALDSAGDIVALVDTPTVEVVKDKKRRHEPDVDGMRDVLLKLAELGDIRLVTLEKVQAMPSIPRKGLRLAADASGATEGWGATPNFSLGQGQGLWWGILVALRMPLSRVPPQTWRKAMLPGREKGKEANRMAAIERWPAWAHELRLVKYHGRADAAWLAEYGRRSNQGG